MKVESDSPLTFRAPPDVRKALVRRKAEGANVSALIVIALRRFLQLQALADTGSLKATVRGERRTLVNPVHILAKLSQKGIKK